MKECPNKCPSFAMAEDVFCGRCGLELQELRHCPRCDHPLYMGDVFCRKCGKAVAVKAAEVGKGELAGFWRCGCGHVNGPNLAKCAMCGRTPAESADAGCAKVAPEVKGRDSGMEAE